MRHATLITLVISGCTLLGGNDLFPPVESGATAGGLPESVAAVFRTCTGCHQGPTAPQGLVLDPATAAAQLIGIPSRSVAGGTLIVAGNPDESVVVHAIEGRSGVPQMPPGGSLTEAEIAEIRAWVTSLSTQATDPLADPPLGQPDPTPSTPEAPAPEAPVPAAPEGPQTTARFCHATFVGSTPQLLELVLGDTPLTALGGTCSPCRAVPAGRVGAQLRSVAGNLVDISGTLSIPDDVDVVLVPDFSTDPPGMLVGPIDADAACEDIDFDDVFQ